MFLNFRSTHGTRTAIGLDYSSWRSSVAERHRLQPQAAIQKFDIHRDIRGEEQKVLLVAYGPFYRGWDKEMWRILKEKAWKHVLISTGGSEIETEHLYFEAIRSVEHESRQLYGKDESIDRLPSDQFVWMMVFDGCFFLQVALAALGGFKRLDHLRDFKLLFPGSEKRTTTMIRVAVSSMFVVGNQIPFAVLKVLMGQKFFKDFVRQGIWEEPSDLERWVLFELLLVPVFHGRGRVGKIISTNWELSIFGISIGEAMGFLKKKSPSEKATDLLHGVWLLMTGLAADDSTEDDDDVYEDVNEDSISSTIRSTTSSSSSYGVVPPKVRSAKEIKEAGLGFSYEEGTRINGIRIQNSLSSASLVLPRIVMVSEKEKMFTLFCNLIQYEVKRFGKSKRKMCQYIQLMRELIRSGEDAKVLANDGIIIIDPDQEEEVLSFFRKFDDIPLLRNHQDLIRSVRDELNHFTRPSPFKKLGVVINFVAILTVFQTILSIVSYIHPRN